MSIVESWMPWLFRLETPGLVIFTSLLIALYFWVTETDVGLAITAPWTIKNDRERIARSIGRDFRPVSLVCWPLFGCWKLFF